MIRIKEVIRSKGLEIQQVAEMLGVSRQSLHNKMNGNPNLKTLKEIADTIECEIHELIACSEDFAHFYDKEEWLGIRKK